MLLLPTNGDGGQQDARAVDFVTWDDAAIPQLNVVEVASCTRFEATTGRRDGTAAVRQGCGSWGLAEWQSCVQVAWTGSGQISKGKVRTWQLESGSAGGGRTATSRDSDT